MATVNGTAPGNSPMAGIFADVDGRDAAATTEIVVFVPANKGIMENLDVEPSDLTSTAQVVTFAGALVSDVVDLTAVDDDESGAYGWNGTLSLTSDAAAGGVIVEAVISDDFEIGNDAAEVYKEAFGDEGDVDHDDLGAARVVGVLVAP